MQARNILNWISGKNFATVRKKFKPEKFEKTTTQERLL